MMRLSPRNRSISVTLTWMSVFVSSVAVILVYLSFQAFNLISEKNAAIESLTAVADVIGLNTASAILLHDKASVQTTLSTLADSRNIVAAAIYTGSSIPFAAYPAGGAALSERRAIPANLQVAHWSKGTDIFVASRIVSQGKPIATMYLQARMQDLRREEFRSAAIGGALLLLGFGMAILVGSAFRRMLAQPIVSFAHTARLVTRYRDYSLRFSTEQNYVELEALTAAFNEMLAEIQQRDAALEQAKTSLEARVAERTAQLQSANRELEAFSYTVAHDLRGPLQAIVNLSFLLGATGPPEPQPEESPMLRQLRASVASMSNMIDDLLNLSRSTSAPLHSSETDLSRLAASILKRLGDGDPGREVRIEIQPDCRVTADPGLMAIVLENLLRNAWKFTARRDSAWIEFGSRPAGPDTVYFVRDNGAGFDQQLANRLFKPFQRLHAASEYPGTGIGLATVQRIVLRHGGDAWAEGEVDHGATFYFTLNAHRQVNSLSGAFEETPRRSVPSALRAASTAILQNCLTEIGQPL